MDLVFLHGLPASGKLTTARKLSARLMYPVFHNHLVVNLLTEFFSFGSEPFVHLREKFWLSVIEEASKAGTSLVFTYTPDSTVRRGFPDRVRGVIEESGGRVCFVRLIVSDAEQERRIDSASRREAHKLADLTTLRRLRDNRSTPEQPPVDLEINTELSGAGRSAETIIDHFQLREQPAVIRYPQA